MPLTTIDLLSSLAEGIDFRTGEQLSADHLLNDPRAIRALHWCVQRLASSEDTKAEPSSARPANQGKAWSKEEDKLLTSGFHHSLTFGAIGKAHGRTSGAINRRLQKLLLIP